MSAPGQRAALLLVDLQIDFLARPGLVPDRDRLCARAAQLLDAARRRGLAVIHAQTLTRPDGSDRMPHWKRLGRAECVEGTPGAQAPAALQPADGELVLRKRFFSAFGDARLDPWLRRRGVEHLLVAGVYLQSCVRSTVLDAYERGYEVTVVEDAVGTTEPLHAELTRTYLAERAASFQPAAGVFSDLGEPSPSDLAAPLPVAVIGVAPRQANDHFCIVHRNPCRTAEVLSRVPRGGEAEIEAAAEACESAGENASRLRARRAGRAARWPILPRASAVIRLVSGSCSLSHGVKDMANGAASWTRRAVAQVSPRPVIRRSHWLPTPCRLRPPISGSHGSWLDREHRRHARTVAPLQRDGGDRPRDIPRGSCAPGRMPRTGPALDGRGRGE